MILELEAVSKTYGSVLALDDLSLRVDRDEIVAVLGPNGAGKTTALEIALGLRRPDAGRVRLFGASPSASTTRRRVGATPQESGFPDTLSVAELVAFAAAHYPAPASVAATLATFDLSDLATRRAGALSGGQSRRVALALAFAGNPEFVVLDEPTTGLDVESRHALWNVVRAAAQRRSVLFTTHYLEEAEALATRIVVLAHGALLFDGSPRALRERFGARRLMYVGEPLDAAALGFVADLQHVDGRVVVTTGDTDAYVRAMVAAQVAFRDLEIAAPTLEEAFLSITAGVR